MELRTFIHYGLHFIFPLLIALLFYRKSWKMTYLVFILCMLIDLDHMLATPIFEANRCSINFHPLHTYYAIAVYVGFLFFKKTRILGIGLLMHILADSVDCWMM
ncbi:hypothetical protein IMCC3317_44010 [Kordia antarctica]|uniref:LexA-binding, inner membrane-associated hydrolase n=1 Tax=Kordia antarctica TaxID=1218801 RepID=A0A7L4ZR42_9FLAO|nr:DUF6122 family protein [Kordia antarctica]QHI39001.1 hypothetical protein IMCC3317_44010 [Kordia antarctica]